MGGVFQQISSYQSMADFPDIHFLFTGQKETKQLGENILSWPMTALSIIPIS